MNGVCTEWSQSWNYSSGAIKSESGLWYRVISGRDLELDCIGRCFMSVNEPVTFEPGEIQKAKRTIRVARDIRRPWRELGIDPATHREICVVKSEGFLVRSLGGLLVVRDDDLAGISAGSIVECGVTASPGYPTWRATDIRFVAADEEEYNKSLLEERNATEI